MAPNSIHDPSRDYTLHPTFAQLSAAQQISSTKPAITAIAAGAHYTAALYSDGLVRVCGVSRDISWFEPNWEGICAIFPGEDCLYAKNRDGILSQLSFIKLDKNIPLSSVYGYKRIKLNHFSEAIEIHERSRFFPCFSEHPRLRSIEKDRFGLLEDGTVFTRFPDENRLVSHWSGITAVAAGAHHYFALTGAGELLCAGDRRYKVMQEAHGWRNITAIAAGAEHLIGLRENGTVIAAGRSNERQCSTDGWYDIAAIAARSNHTIGLRKNGSVVAIGDNTHGQCSVGAWSNIVSVATSACHTVGLRADGTLVAVGDNTYGQCSVHHLMR